MKEDRQKDGLLTMNEIVKKNNSLATKSEGFQSITQLANSLPVEAMTEPRCKLCNHELRAEAEAMWDKLHNYNAIHRWLTNEKKVEISEPAVKHHLRDHYAKNMRDMQIAEYAKNFKDYWANLHQNEEDSLKEQIALLNKQVYETLALTDQNDISEVRKTNDSVTKLMDLIGKKQERLETMKKVASPARILVEKFRNIILIRAENIQSNEAKEVLVGILTDLEKDVEGMRIDE